ncbi:sensor domain-containing diguanylate cyclase [Geobacter sp. AOG2]|uniref:sensor domain-containing diguanylate cyclase n=1 Tax=Geobacter sp. AOG2 TaxID=1566347 RepID=UPI001CC4C67B|nr:sensor domain-containing diguanylate cyclase [Geobacter sp. AOG2]
MQKRFALTFSAFLIVVFALIVWGFLSYSVRLTRDNIQKQQFAMTELIARSIDDKLGTYLATIAMISAEADPRILNDPEKARTFLENHRALLGIFDNGIYLFGTDYTLKAEVPVFEERRETRAVRLRAFLESVKKNNFPDISNPYLSPKTGTPAIAMASPVCGPDDVPRGFLVGSINLNEDYFVEELMGYKIGKTGYLYLFNTDRTMIIHPDKKRIMKRDVPPGANKLYDQAIRGFEGSGETINSRGVPQIVSFKRLRTVDWILASAYPQAEAYAPIRHLRSYLLGAAALVTLFSIVLVWLLTGRVTAGLASFTDQVRRIREHPEEGHEIRIEGSGEVNLLASAFNGLMGELDETHQQLEELTRTDHLTGLFNRRHLELEGPRLLTLAERENGASALLMVDVDRFKQVNDSYGHEAGDAVLVHIGVVLRKAVRPYDLVVRYGGEEFLVLLPLITTEEALEAAERIRRTIQDTPVCAAGDVLSVTTVSIGVYVAENIGDLQDAVARADEALYEAKKGGRNRVCLAPPAEPAPGAPPGLRG